MSQERKNLMGFVYGFKEGHVEKTDTGSVARISFVTGTSAKFPKKFEKKKDFYAEPVYEGDASDLFLDPRLIASDFSESYKPFAKFFADGVSDHIVDSSADDFARRSHFFGSFMSFEQYAAVTTFLQAIPVIIGLGFESDDVFVSLLDECVGFAFKESGMTALDGFLFTRDALAASYDRETDFALKGITI